MSTVTVRTSSEEYQRRLKAELQQLRRRGALRPGEWGGEGRACARCRGALGRLVNRGAPCRACRLPVCRACRHYLARSPDWVCSVCHKHMEIQAATGEWMNEYVRRPSRRRDNRVYVPPADIIKRSIRRSWTISNSSPRWSAARGSPELRAYSSLPRHQECCYTSLNHVARDGSPHCVRDENCAPASPNLTELRQSSPQRCGFTEHSEKFHSPKRAHSPLTDDSKSLPRSPISSTFQQCDRDTTNTAFRERLPTSPLPMSRIRRQQYASSRSDDDATDHVFHSPQNQSTFFRNHLDNGRPRSDETIGGTGVRDFRSSSPCSSPSVRESRSISTHENRDTTPSSTSHSSREVSPLTRRHQSFDVMDKPVGRAISMLQQRQSLDRDSMPSSTQHRYFATGQDSSTSSTSPVPNTRHAFHTRDSAVPSSQRRSVFNRDYVTSNQDYSGNSDSGGEIIATPPLQSRRFRADQDDSSLSSPKAGGSPIHPSSGDDFDVEPISGTIFRKVTVKKRRQETRRIVDNGRGPRRSSRVVESVRVTEVTRSHQDSEPLLLPPDGEDYKLVFISSEESSSKEEDDVSSSSSAGCDWDYFESGFPPPRAAPREEGARGGGPLCAACGSATVLPVPVPIPVPVPYPVPVWPMEEGVRIRLVGPWWPSGLISPGGSTVVAISAPQPPPQQEMFIRQEKVAVCDGAESDSGFSVVSDAKGRDAVVARDERPEPDQVDAVQAHEEKDAAAEDEQVESPCMSLLPRERLGSTSSEDSGQESDAEATGTYNFGAASSSDDDDAPFSTTFVVNGGGDSDSEAESSGVSDELPCSEDAADVVDGDGIVLLRHEPLQERSHETKQRGEDADRRVPKELSESDDSGDEDDSGGIVVLKYVRRLDEQSLPPTKLPDLHADKGAPPDCGVAAGSPVPAQLPRKSRIPSESDSIVSEKSSDNIAESCESAIGKVREVINQSEAQKVEEEYIDNLENISVTVKDENSVGDGVNNFLDTDVSEALQVASEASGAAICEAVAERCEIASVAEDARQVAPSAAGGGNSAGNAPLCISLESLFSENTTHRGHDGRGATVSSTSSEEDDSALTSNESVTADSAIECPSAGERRQESKICDVGHNSTPRSEDSPQEEGETKEDPCKEGDQDAANTEEEVNECVKESTDTVDECVKEETVVVKEGEDSTSSENIELLKQVGEVEPELEIISVDEGAGKDVAVITPDSEATTIVVKEEVEEGAEIILNEVIEVASAAAVDNDEVDTESIVNETVPVDVVNVGSADEVSGDVEAVTGDEVNTVVEVDNGDEVRGDVEVDAGHVDDKHIELETTEIIDEKIEGDTEDVDGEEVELQIKDGVNGEIEVVTSVEGNEEVEVNNVDIVKDILDESADDALKKDDGSYMAAFPEGVEVDTENEDNDVVTSAEVSDGATVNSCDDEAEGAQPPVEPEQVTIGAAQLDGAQTDGAEEPGAAPACSVGPGASRQSDHVGERYTSLVMITQDAGYKPVSVVTSETTTLVPGDVVVRHTNWEESGGTGGGLAGYYTLALEAAGAVGSAKRPLVTRTRRDPQPPPTTPVASEEEDVVHVVTGAGTLSAVVCLEEGLADDDSWVEEIDDREEEFATTTPTEEDSSSGDEARVSESVAASYADREEELRGYHRTAIDFTLHTIVEESCEESEVEREPDARGRKSRPTSASELEKYFFFGLGGSNSGKDMDSFSDTCSSIYSEGLESLGAEDAGDDDGTDAAELASSRLEKYFLTGFMGFPAADAAADSDGGSSGSVGSDSEGRPSPEQRRKRLVTRARRGQLAMASTPDATAPPSTEVSGGEAQNHSESEDSSSTETEATHDDAPGFEKPDGQFDTVKRKKKRRSGCPSPAVPSDAAGENLSSDGDEDGAATPQPEFPLPSDLSASRNKQQSRDSGFIGSCDDLLKEQRSSSDSSSNEPSSLASHKAKAPSDAENDSSPSDAAKIAQGDAAVRNDGEVVDKNTPTHQPPTISAPPATALTRKDSFNNWSSDEETNLMMSKMRAFFKTIIAAAANSNNNAQKTPQASPGVRPRSKPPQLVYFESELTRLMKTVPGIRDDQVREIVEYLSSEDTWSDSYDSSDYTSSDLEGAYYPPPPDAKSELQEQISASCQQIIDKFDTGAEDEDEGEDTTLVYRRLVASFSRMAEQGTPHSSPPLLDKVMHHIGSRLVALMHEVEGGITAASPKVRYHRRLQHKASTTSTTTEEDEDSHTDTESTTAPAHVPHGVGVLPRSKSHDLLLEQEAAARLRSSSSGVSDMTEEREASDYERFSWRGSFESALMAADSRTKLSLLAGGVGGGGACDGGCASKRRSAGDLLLSCSREHLDRVRSCGSIGGLEEKAWRQGRRRSSVPDAGGANTSGASADGDDDEDDEEDDAPRSTTLPRSLQTSCSAGTNSLPRLPTSASGAVYKAHSVHHLLPSHVKSARYRPPGFNRPVPPKRAVSAPGLQPPPPHPRRDARRRLQASPQAVDDASISEETSSPLVLHKTISKSASPSPIVGGTSSRKNSTSLSVGDFPEDESTEHSTPPNKLKPGSTLSPLGARSDSLASVYSGAGEGRYGTVTVRGDVEFGLQYNYKAGALEILVKQCRDLAPVDSKRNRSDPYVKVYLLPDKSKSGKRKTKVKKHTLNPVFDETLKFNITLNGLETRTLWLTVWHSDMFGRNDFLGEVTMPLENKVFNVPTPQWYPLQERTEPFDDLLSYKGDIIIGLKFVPPDVTVQKKGKRSRGSLNVLVKEAKNLTAVKANGTSDPFCKSYLLPDKGRSSKQKTPVLRRTCNPVWNYTFVYEDVSLQELSERSLELTVWDHDRLASNEFLGGLRFNLGTGKHYGKAVDWMDATGKEMTLWQKMLERPNFWVEGCLTLRSSLEHRGS